MRPYKFYDFELPPLENSDYGFQWPSPGGGRSIDQITKELTGFRFNGKGGHKFKSRYHHGLNLIRMLWPEQVQLFRKWKNYQTGQSEVIWNHYFLRAFKALCRGKRTCFTGCSSSGKTFSVAVYCVLMFISDPQNTTIMVSTTAGTDAERRVWGEIKDLHNALDRIYPVGSLIDYLKVITFDPGQELAGRKDISARDLRNGIILIPIPKGSEGDNALGKIIGTKNKTVIWVIDEMPHMLDNVTRPESNLESNIFFQLIGIGNANKPSDPHGLMCEPIVGWENISPEDEEWEGFADTLVLFFHGEESPNFHPAVDPSITDRSRYPFPYLSNPIYVNRTAELNGRGNPEFGRKTIDFWRFAIGFWSGDDVINTILSSKMVKEFEADRDDIDWGHKERQTICGCDVGFTAGGDSIALCFCVIGEDVNGRQRMQLDSECVNIKSTVQDRESFRTDVSRQIVAECRKRRLLPSNFFMDINADGGLMMQAIQKEWGTHECVGLSSLEPTEDNDRFDNIVTQYWYQVADAITTRSVRGFNTLSRYAKDMFARTYESVGKGKVKVEKKSDMKKRIKRSPDEGDSLSYCVEGAKRRGFSLKWELSPTNIELREDLDRRFRGQLTDDPGPYIEHDVTANEEFEYEESYN